MGCWWSCMTSKDPDGVQTAAVLIWTTEGVPHGACRRQGTGSWWSCMTCRGC